MFYTMFPSYPTMTEPVPSVGEPLRDGLRLGEGQTAVYDVDKRSHRIRFVDENEERVRLVIEPRQ